MGYLVTVLHLPPAMAELAVAVMHPPATFSVSAYVETGLTASGAMAGPGLAACGPGYAFGTLFVLNDGQQWRCADRGGAVTNGHLDVWMESYDDAIQWGRRRMTAWVMEG